MNEKQLIQHARANRKSPTKSEQILWKLLRSKQLCNAKFRRQHVIDRYIVDFACVQEKIVVEIDGGYHDQVELQDKVRQGRLEQLGWTVVRFTSEQVEEQPEAVLEVIANTMQRTMMFNKREYLPSGLMKRKAD